MKKFNCDEFSFDNQRYIDSIKFETIQKVKYSNLYKKNKKPYIIDSLNNISIKLSVPIGKLIMSKHTAGIFVNMEELSIKLNGHTYFKKLKSNKRYIILINNRYLNDIDLAEIITHELYHYLDELMYNISDTINKYNIVDEKLLNEDDLIDKIAFLYDIEQDDITPHYKEIILSLSGHILDKKSYLSKNQEIFTRWKTFKSKLVDLNHIEDVNSIVHKSTIKKYIDISKYNISDLELLLILDLDKLETLDKLVN